MKKMFLLVLLTGWTLLLPTARLFAEEQAGTDDQPVEVELSAEDQAVIELMDLLQVMDLLEDFQVVALGEETK